MSLEQQIADAIVIAFDELGGDPYEAVRKALYHRRVEDWVSDETTKIALAGGAEMLIPGLHALTIPAGITYLLHKMAHISWGIGALKKAYIVETPYYSDIRNILTIYANNEQYNANLLDYQAISLDTYTYALTKDGYAHLQRLTQDTPRIDTTAKSWDVLKTLSQEYASDDRAYNQLKTLTSAKIADKARDDSDGRYMTEADRVELEQIERRIGAKLALKLATQIAARVPARFLMGFVPVAGAIVNAFFNTQTLKSMATAADVYYSNAITKDDLQNP
jgi:hypothetical protein